MGRPGARIIPQGTFAAESAPGHPTPPPVAAGEQQALDAPAYVYERIGERVRVTQPAWRKPIDVTSAGSLIFGLGPSAVFAVIGWSLFRHELWAPGLLFFLIGATVLVVALGLHAGPVATRRYRAMAELKQRMTRLAERDRHWLDYWVRTGEPRLAARRC